MAIPNVLAIANGKGGAGKTSLAANLAGTAACSGWKVLAVDLDPQGNLGRDLGYLQQDRSDHGASLLKAIASGDAPSPIVGVRPGLDVVAGGEHTEEIEALLQTRQRRDNKSVTALRECLAPLATDYQLIVLDCPPSSGSILEAALTAARHLVIPTRGDAASFDGLARIARKFGHVRDSGANPDIVFLGVVLFDFGRGDRALIASARQQLEADLGGAAPVFEPFVRNSRKAPSDMRRLGQLAYEYERASLSKGGWKFSRSAEGLAADYQAITAAVLKAYTAELANS